MWWASRVQAVAEGGKVAVHLLAAWAILNELGKEALRDNECTQELFARLVHFPNFHWRVLDELTDDEIIEFCGDFVKADNDVYALFDDEVNNPGMVKALSLIHI